MITCQSSVLYCKDLIEHITSFLSFSEQKECEKVSKIWQKAIQESFYPITLNSNQLIFILKSKTNQARILSKIQGLNLNHTLKNLRTIPIFFHNTLQFLMLSKNALSSETLDQLHLENFKNLSFLDISHNQIRRSPQIAHLFSKLTKLKSLNISKNHLDPQTAQSLLDNLPQTLTELDLSENNLWINLNTHISFLTLTNLQTLNLSSNMLSDVHFDSLDLHFFENLTSLNLSDNLIACASLKKLSLQKMPHLKTMNLASNIFMLNCCKSLNLASFPNLEHLDLSYNLISVGLENLNFASIPKLQKLYLKAVQITDNQITPKILSDLKNLKILNIEKNQISSKCILKIKENYTSKAITVISSKKSNKNLSLICIVLVGILGTLSLIIFNKDLKS